MDVFFAREDAEGVAKVIEVGIFAWLSMSLMTAAKLTRESLSIHFSIIKTLTQMVPYFIGIKPW